MLNRFLSSKSEKEHGSRTKRPYLASACRDLNEADKWRSEILRDIGRKVMDIQNAALGEHRLRDLNDEINKLIREKAHWESRIVALGGPNYARAAPRVADGDAGAVGGGGRGYRYFGAAKGLPGVKELFEKAAPRTVRRTRHQMQQSIDAEYYGFRDEEDGVLARVEAAAESTMLASAREQFLAEQAVRAAAAGEKLEAGQELGPSGVDAAFTAHVPLPDAAAIESLVLQKKKRELLAKYASAELQAEETQARALLGKRGR